MRQPNAAQLKFTPDCYAHLKSIFDTGISERSFASMKRGKYCCIQLLKFLANVKLVYEMQQDIKDYFTPSNPSWFRKLIGQRKHYEVTEANIITMKRCIDLIEAERTKRKNAGIKLSAVQMALSKAHENLSQYKKDSHNIKMQLEDFYRWLDETERHHKSRLESLCASKELAATVAKRDLEYYMNTALNLDELRLKELHFLIDEKSISLVETQVDIINANEKYIRERNARNFDSIYDISEVHGYCVRLGEVLSTLYVLQNDWTEFLESIGGLQFVNDLVVSS